MGVRTILRTGIREGIAASSLGCPQRTAITRFCRTTRAENTAATTTPCLPPAPIRSSASSNSGVPLARRSQLGTMPGDRHARHLAAGAAIVDAAPGALTASRGSLAFSVHGINS